jgi:DNA-binding CsgD family transcriptional regulator
MPVATPFDAVVLSSRGLVRDLLAELLRARCGAFRVSRCATVDECLAASPTARMLVCDADGVPAASLARVLARLRDTHPRLQILCVDDSFGSAGMEELVKLARVGAPDASLPHESLTPLESDVMLAVAAGQRNSEIARRMRRSSKTVEKHRANAQRKLGCRNVAQLTAYAIKHGLLDGDSILATRNR